MACGMLASIGDFLRMGNDEIVKNMYELSDNDEDEDMEIARAIALSTETFATPVRAPTDDASSSEEEEDDDDDEELARAIAMSTSTS